MLRLIGLSHHVAPVELRELVALPGPDDLAGKAGEAVCLSTCNRTEVYLAGDATEPDWTGVDDVLYRLEDEAAARHLFRVAAGLDSLVPGEGEILGQVRAAYEAGAPGPLLDRLFRQALHAGKRVRSQTSISESPASVPAAAAALAAQVFGDLAGSRVALVGAGKAGELAARALTARGAELSVVSSRSLEKAAELAARFGGVPIALDRLREALDGVNVVVSATSAPGYVLTRADVEATKARPLFLIDIAVPRDLDPSIHELDGCFLYDIDDLEAVVAESLAGRRREAARAEAIVAEETERFRTWLASRTVVPEIASLRARAEEIRAGELERMQRRLARLPESERRAVESLTSQLVNKLLHLPTVRMKEAAAGADGALYADTVRDLFGLGEEKR